MSTSRAGVRRGDRDVAATSIPQPAVAQAAGEFAELLPDGLASRDMHLWTAVVGDEAVGIGWIELRQRDVRRLGLDLRHPASTPPARGQGLVA